MVYRSYFRVVVCDLDLDEIKQKLRSYGYREVYVDDMLDESYLIHLHTWKPCSISSVRSCLHAKTVQHVTSHEFREYPRDELTYHDRCWCVVDHAARNEHDYRSSYVMDPIVEMCFSEYGVSLTKRCDRCNRIFHKTVDDYKEFCRKIKDFNENQQNGKKRKRSDSPTSVTEIDSETEIDEPK